jgi:hypothetical protein
MCGPLAAFWRQAAVTVPGITAMCLQNMGR